MPITINGTTGISGVDGSAGAPALIGSDADTGLVFAAGQISGSINGTAVNVGLLQETAKNSTSGTNIDFTGIPSWVKRITVALNGVSTGAGSTFLIQLGAGSVDATGYSAGIGTISNAPAASFAQFTTGISVGNTAAAADLLNSVLTLVNVSGNIWVGSGTFFRSGATQQAGSFAGNKSLSGTLDRLRLTTSAGDTFDAGSVNILYE